MQSFFTAININTVILAICAVALGLQQWRQGSSKVSAETIVAYEAQSKINKETLISQANQINSLSTEVGKLTGIIQEKDKQLSDYKEIFQGRNPQLEEILTNVVKLMQKLDGRLEGIEKVSSGPSITTTTVKQ